MKLVEFFPSLTSCASAALLMMPLVLATAGAAPAAADGLTANDVAKIRRVSSAAVSPDGKHVAYTVSVQRKPFEDEDGPAWTELHVMGPEGKSRPFITGEVSVSSVSWTPDGKGIAFTAKREGDDHSALYVIPVDGGEARRILEHETGVSSYSFNGDGTQVAFLATEKLGKDKEKEQEKGFKQEVYEEDGLYTRAWVKNLEDEEAEARELDLEGSASELHWSPVDDRLAVALQPEPLVDQRYTSRKVNVVDISGEEAKVVATFDNPGKIGAVAWSPDGKRLAMTSALDKHDPSPGRLVVVPAGGGPLEYVVGEDYEGDVADFVWASNDTVLAVVSQFSQNGLAEIGLDGKVTWKVEPGEACWGGLNRADDGTLALLGNTAGHPDELYRGTAAGGFQKLTDSNPWLADKAMGAQEVFSWKARDGKRIEGVLIKPVGVQEGQRYPLIVNVHGGPEAYDCNGWLTGYSDPGQIAAAKGYAVLHPNYRGSTGRGVAFAKEHQADPAGKEFDDIVDGVDALIASGLVDGDKVGITGGSYGGFATAWGATYYSERYAAAVMFVGISNHISKSGTTDIPDEITLVHQQKRIWEDWQFFLERSPLYHVQKARTPLLILHGQDDTRVHPGQSLELYRAVKTLGQTPVRYVKYPGEGHGNRKAAARYDYSQRMMRWFDHYLMGEGGEPPAYAVDYKAALGIEDDEDDEEDGGSEDGGGEG